MAIRFFLLTAFLSVSSCSESPARVPNTFDIQTRPPSSPVGRVVDAEKYPGSDIGAKVNAADAALGTSVGEIRVSSGGNIATQINISPGHTLRIARGLYTATTNSSVIRLKDNSALECNNWEAVLFESTAKAGASSPFTIVRDFNGDISNYAASQNIIVRGCHFKGARSDFNSTPQTVGLGNCRNCKAINNWLDATRTIGIQAGGGSGQGNYAANVLIADNLLTQVASQNIAVTNAEDVVVNHNVMRNPSQLGGPGVSVIDVEPNSGDRLKNIRISNNNIDATQATTFNVTNGIAVQNYNTKNYGPVELLNNTIIGAAYSTPKNDYIVYAGVILNNATNVLIRNNYIQRVPWGIKLNSNSDRFIIAGNELSSCGSGSTYAISVVDSSDGLVVNNYLHEGINDKISVGVIAVQVVENTLGGRIAGNVYMNNLGAVYHLIGAAPDSNPNRAKLISDWATSFSNLSQANEGTMIYCSDCRASDPCAGGGTGRWAKRQNGIWKCS